MFANIGMVQLLIVLVIVLLIFGTKRLRQAGGDLGAMIGGFKKEVNTKDLIETANDARKAKKAFEQVKKVMK